MAINMDYSKLVNKTQAQIFGENLARYMDKTGKTKKELVLYLQADPKTVKLWLKGVRRPQLEHSRKISEWLGVELNDLYLDYKN
ncbi:MAG: helix-turn-helix domain-containing protein [Butyrivibrio sp.]|nr:helix-turn-helix domain-containing protein [Butyrivibrio sp.]